MEEAVTKKFVHEDSSHIIALCSTVEACLLHMLKRRAAGFLRSDKIAALFTKIGKVDDTTGEVCRKVQGQLQQQQQAEASRSERFPLTILTNRFLFSPWCWWAGRPAGALTGSCVRCTAIPLDPSLQAHCAAGGTVEACLLHMLKRRAAGFLRSDKIAALFTKIGKVDDTTGEVCRKVQGQLQQQQQAEASRRAQSSSPESLKRQSSTAGRPPQPLSPQAIKHIWVRTALFEKVLDKIVQYIVDNCSKYYEKEALMHDAVFGPILAALLVGPCALEYTKLKTSDHFWTDPSANELVQRHRIHGAHSRQDSSPGRRPTLGVRAPTHVRGVGGRISGSVSPAAACRRINLPRPRGNTWSRCTRTRAPTCSMARTTCWCNRAGMKAVPYLPFLFPDPHPLPLLSSPLLPPTLRLPVGPCALEYTKLKTSDHFWTDPSANELVQRHRIHGAHSRQDSSPGRRPTLGIRKRQSSGSMSEDKFAASAREYVESLHQNSRTHLLYGKNNVLVQPKEDMEVLRGYLSLHQAAENLTLKWTPNQLINGTLGDCDLEKSIYWDYALTVPLRQIVCIHCHQRPDCGGTLVLVSQDGIQRPPLHFPPGGHLLAFLSCLESGLLPRGQLEPPLWSQRGKGKVFPKLRRRNSTTRLGEPRDTGGEEEIAADYVFRIVYPGHRHESIMRDHLIQRTCVTLGVLMFFLAGGWGLLTITWCLPFLYMDCGYFTGSRISSSLFFFPKETGVSTLISWVACSTLPPPSGDTIENPTPKRSVSHPGDMIEMQGFGSSPLSWQQGESGSHVSSCLSCSTGGSSTPYELHPGCTCIHDRIPLKMLCQNMKKQIVSRAFYGWLAYCRHLSTVRTHLSALVNHNIVPPDKPCEASGGLSKDVWSKYQKDCKMTELLYSRDPNHASMAFWDVQFWLAYCRHLSTVRTHLSALVNHNIVPPDKPCEASGGLSKDVWSKYQKDCKNYKELELLRLVYYGGVEHKIRKEVWPFLLGHYKFGMGKKEMTQIDEKVAAKYQQVMEEWKACEAIVKQREKETHSAIFTKLSSGSSIDSHVQRLVHRDSTISNEASRRPRLSDSQITSWVFMSVEELDSKGRGLQGQEDGTTTLMNVGTPVALAPDERPLVEFDSPDSGLPSSRNYSVASGHSQIMSSIEDAQSMEEEPGEEGAQSMLGEQGRQDSLCEEQLCGQVDRLMTGPGGAPLSLSSYTELTASSQLLLYWSVFALAVALLIELLDTVALNLHRIDKDVQRCDRNYYYFTQANLEKLRNIMCSYVWEHLEMGYVQGMCDLLAPLMVILDDECLAYSCFTQLMKKMSQNFPNGGAMDTHFANMRSLIQILDSELFELMHQNGDYTHFYFCYRWFLLDFKRELLYEDLFEAWEVIWAARHISSEHFVLFMALALVEVYREIILDNNMDFTDIIKFFNEMAERHDVQQILRLARELVHKVQTLIENK
ncbi:SGSM2 protein, partial [Atractosteus spatula]|nr:SGSM2 protein [Atractosteus spatula]